ncbi:GntP family permease [Prolixibacter denitrificans]|uniref:GntP family gluconate:H+ symporter n=1 Tax=Prolixibacter denitrificans TaxID=1541063 RepID=A0A2P8CDR2_9BACT|nr:GntP family permease [Prolixibacter denitrificans]PSK83115.1 GntP family gluconate:H+ symporter [Prolixibacter denitrificans]GET22002.1 permease [Prolixibacter denitrificans]
MVIILALILVIFLVVIATTKFNIHPFLSLLFAAVVMGFVSGMDGGVIVRKLTEGFGKTLSSIGIIIAFGTIIGVYLEKSGGAMKIARTILKMIGEKRSALAMNLTGFIVSIPVFCDSGFVILSRLNKALSKKSGISLVVFAISLAAGLYATHVFVPPTPGPLAAAAALKADLGMVIFLGLIVALPVSLAGYFWAKFISKRVSVVVKEETEMEEEPEKLPGNLVSFAPIIFPIILIALKSIADYPTHPFGSDWIYQVLVFMGNPVIALFMGVILAFALKHSFKETHFDWTIKGLKEAGVIILITGAGGAFGEILRAGGIGDIIGSGLSDFQVGILLPFILAAILKSAQGSSTVAIITTAAIVSPLLGSLGLSSETSKALTVLAIGAGAMTVSHLNDSYFWVVSQFSDMNTSTALKSQTMATLLQGITGIIIIYTLNLIIG